MKVVTLKNGAAVVESAVISTMVLLEELQKQDPVALYELVQFCRDPNHPLFGNTGEVLKRYSLVKHGVIHSAIRDVVLSAVESDGLDMRLADPVAV